MVTAPAAYLTGPDAVSAGSYGRQGRDRGDEPVHGAPRSAHPRHRPPAGRAPPVDTGIAIAGAALALVLWNCPTPEVEALVLGLVVIARSFSETLAGPPAQPTARPRVTGRSPAPGDAVPHAPGLS